MSVSVPLDNIQITLKGGADFDLDAIANALTTGVKAGITIATPPEGIKVDAGLDKIDVKISQLPIVQAEVSIKEIPLIRTDSKVDLGLDDIRIREFPPVKFELSFKPIRVHFPLNYSFSIELFGVRLFKFSLCGEGMTVAEDYQSHATERCDQ